MAIAQHLTHWLGYPLVDFQGTLDDPTGTAWALRVADGDRPFSEALEQLLNTAGSERLKTLVIGTWHEEMYDCDSSLVVDLLVQHRQRLAGLRHLFLGEITYDEFEISWIVQSDLAPLLRAFPQLEWLTVRGASSLAFTYLEHSNLRGLVVESGGLAATTLAQIAHAELPQLEHLEVWLGSDNYGGDSSVADLQPILQDRFPRLRRLGLCNSEYAADIVEGLARSAVLDRVQELDLSRGNLDDAGAQPLIKNARFHLLKLLDVNDNYLSDRCLAELKARLPRVISEEQRDPDGDDGDRYCSVSE